MNPKRERWLELCEQASREQDPHRLSLLVDEINLLLAARGRPQNAVRTKQGAHPELRCE
jgi:hypothetical protein